MEIDIYANMVNKNVVFPTKTVVIDIQIWDCLVDEMRGYVSLPSADFTPIYYNSPDPFTLSWAEYT